LYFDWTNNMILFSNGNGSLIRFKEEPLCRLLCYVLNSNEFITKHDVGKFPCKLRSNYKVVLISNKTLSHQRHCSLEFEPLECYRRRSVLFEKWFQRVHPFPKEFGYFQYVLFLLFFFNLCFRIGKWPSLRDIINTRASLILLALTRQSFLIHVTANGWRTSINYEWR
jgi:hypothetical protein